MRSLSVKWSQVIQQKSLFFSEYTEDFGGNSWKKAYLEVLDHRVSALIEGRFGRSP